jgi:hypothetical protein
MMASIRFDSRRGSRLRLLHALGMLLILVIGFHPSLGRAQTDNDGTDETPAKIVRKPIAKIPFHRHGGGGDDERPAAATLRSDPHSLDRTRWDIPAAPGLALDHAPLPGEMGPAPEPAKPLFDKQATGLASRPDNWEIPNKQ